jgi:hypothetical protein
MSLSRARAGVVFGGFIVDSIQSYILGEFLRRQRTSVALRVGRSKRSIHRLSLGSYAISQGADRLVRRSSDCRIGVYCDCKKLIFNNHARGMSVAYPQPSRTKHNKARPSPAKLTHSQGLASVSAAYFSFQLGLTK